MVLGQVYSKTDQHGYICGSITSHYLPNRAGVSVKTVIISVAEEIETLTVRELKSELSIVRLVYMN